MQSFGSSAKAQIFSNSDEIAEMTQLHWQNFRSELVDTIYHSGKDKAILYASSVEDNVSG
jgi:hypothetical protein